MLVYVRPFLLTLLLVSAAKFAKNVLAGTDRKMLTTFSAEESRSGTIMTKSAD